MCVGSMCMRTSFFQHVPTIIFNVCDYFSTTECAYVCMYVCMYVCILVYWQLDFIVCTCMCIFILSIKTCLNAYTFICIRYVLYFSLFVFVFFLLFMFCFLCVSQKQNIFLWLMTFLFHFCSHLLLISLSLSLSMHTQMYSISRIRY